MDIQCAAGFARLPAMRPVGQGALHSQHSNASDGYGFDWVPCPGSSQGGGT